jgi:CheY-like chemotaxis protein
MPIPILVADSNREFGILIRQALEESGRFEVSLASSADEAVSLAKDLDFRLAIIDFALPDIEGEKIVERLRALQPGLAVIGIPVDDGDSSEKTRQAGVDGILTKPFYLPNLPDISQEALGRRLDFTAQCNYPGHGKLRPKARRPTEPNRSVNPSRPGNGISR